MDHHQSTRPTRWNLLLRAHRSRANRHLHSGASSKACKSHPTLCGLKESSCLSLVPIVCQDHPHQHHRPVCISRWSSIFLCVSQHLTLTYIAHVFVQRGIVPRHVWKSMLTATLEAVDEPRPIIQETMSGDMDEFLARI